MGRTGGGAGARGQATYTGQLAGPGSKTGTQGSEEKGRSLAAEGWGTLGPQAHTHSSRKMKYSLRVTNTSTSCKMLGCFTLAARGEPVVRPE